MRFDTLDCFLRGGWQKKSPATEGERTYSYANKGSNNLPNNQIICTEKSSLYGWGMNDEANREWDEIQDKFFSDEDNTEWVTTTSQNEGDGKTPIGSPYGLGEDTTAEDALAPQDDSNQEQAPTLKSLHNAPELPIWGMPKFFQMYCKNVTDTYQCPREFVVGAMFVAVSTAVGNRVLISTPKYKKKPMSLWVSTIAPSGSNKSEPVKEVMRPLREINLRMEKEHKKRVEEIRQSGNNEPLPTKKRLLISGDATPESRTEALANNPLGICQYEDELSTIFLNLNRYNQNAGVTDLLKVWDGSEVQCDRKSKDVQSILIDKSFLCMLGNIQPELLQDIFSHKTYIASGFNQRWMFLYPEEINDEDLNDAVVNPNLSIQWDWVINILQTILEAKELRFDEDAYQRYRQYHSSLQVKKRGKKSPERAVYAKLQIQALRLAGIIHMMHVAANAKFRGDSLWIDDDLLVNDEEMRYAIDCMEYFEHTAKKVMEIVSPKATLTEGAKLNNKQLIKLMSERFKISNKQAFADAIGVSRPYVSGIINEK